ncbi:MAG: hypothetical protein ABSD38_17790 [Syntrophorhabdales bacterium]|jgi:hypothetical protein
MKKLIVLAIIMAVMVLVAALAHAQIPANDLKPTFISPTPGLFVNGWPAFTVSYPKEWAEMPRGLATVFQTGAPRPDLPPSPVLTISVFLPPSYFRLDDWASVNGPLWIDLGTGIKVLSDKPSQLKDGTPAREGELEWVTRTDARVRSVENGAKIYHLLLATERDGIWVEIRLSDDRGRIGDDLKRIAYSLTFQPGREKPVQVPPMSGHFLTCTAPTWWAMM